MELVPHEELGRLRLRQFISRVGKRWRYSVGCTVLDEGGLTYVTVVARDSREEPQAAPGASPRR